MIMAIQRQFFALMVMMLILWASLGTSLLHTSPTSRITISEPPTTPFWSQDSIGSSMLPQHDIQDLSESLPGAPGEKSPLPNNLTGEEEAVAPGASQESTTLSLELRKHGKMHNNSDLCWNGTSIPVPACNEYRWNYNVTLQQSSSCNFSCTYKPNKKWPVRLEVDLHYTHPASHPSFIIAQQTYNITAWTLPVTFPALGNDQKFTSLAVTLCPPWSWGESIETVSVRLTTESQDLVSMQVSVKQDQNFEMMKTKNETVIASPASPWYKLYTWGDGEESVLVTVDSGDKRSGSVCAVLMLQNAQCPVSLDVPEMQSGGTRFQTFTVRGGMVAHRDHYPDGVFIIVRPLPDDAPCTLIYSAHGNRTKRTKSVMLEVWNHGTFMDSWYIFAVAATMIIAAATGFAVISRLSISRTLGAEISDDDRARLLSEFGESGGSGYLHMEQNGGVLFAGMGNQNAHSENSPRNPAQGSSSTLGRGEGEQRGNGGGMSTLPINQGSGPFLPVGGPVDPESDGDRLAVTSGPAPYPLPSTYTPHASLMNFTDCLNPLYVIWWKRVAVFQMDTIDFRVSEVGFQNNLIIMGLFAALPTTELLRSYISMLMNEGMEDKCFFNYRCMVALGRLPDFASVFTNIGYVSVGVACVFIIKKHQQLTQVILNKYTAMDSVGVSRHYGLLTALGYGLIIQGIMSGLYHTCPNKVTIRFDMMFMYVMLVVCIVNVWGLRHGDVTHHVYPTTMGVGAILMLAELREWVSREVFWSIFTIMYCVVLIANTILMARYGIWSFSPYKMWHVWKGWRPVMKELEEMIRLSVVKQSDKASTPLQVIRVTTGLVANIALITCGIALDPNVYTFILIVCLLNTGLYFLNYVITKRIVHQEKGTVLAWLYLLVSLAIWIPALLAYFAHNSDSEASPSSSRALNAPCVMLGVFDYHDIWHITSAFGLGFFFIGLLTLDDDQCNTLSEKLHVF